MAKVPFLAEHANMPRIILNVESVGLSPEQFFQLCRDNPEARIELTAQKEIIIMSPTNMKTGMLNAEITRQLANWAKQEGRGVAFDSSTLFTLPNAAKRSPDGSWILKSRCDAPSPDPTEYFDRICPDFVLELWSPNDILKELPHQDVGVCGERSTAWFPDLSAQNVKSGFTGQSMTRNVWINPFRFLRIPSFPASHWI